MNVSLTPELEQFVKGMVETGRYGSASEVFREGLRMLEKSERRRLLEKAFVEGLTPEEEARMPPELLRKMRDRIHEEIQVGLEQIERGEAIDGEEYFARRRARRASKSAEREPSHTE